MLTAAPEGWSGFQSELLAIRKDPLVKNLALRRAEDPDVAEDALQAAYCAVARVADPTLIRNLRAYFCRTLIHEIYRERGQLRAALIEDFERAAEECQGNTGSLVMPPSSFEDAVCTSIQVRSWHKRLIDERGALRAAVPARSGTPERYRAAIYTAAEQVLRDGISGEASDADTNRALRASFPEYFDQLGASPNTCHQRFSRARMDVRALLQAVVSHDELR